MLLFCLDTVNPTMTLFWPSSVRWINGGTAGCGVVLNEQHVRLHSCIAACVSARRCKLALMRDLVVQINTLQWIMVMTTLRWFSLAGSLNVWPDYRVDHAFTACTFALLWNATIILIPALYWSLLVDCMQRVLCWPWTNRLYVCIAMCDSVPLLVFDVV